MKAYRILFAAALVFAPLFSQAQPQAGEGQRLTPQVMARLFPAGVVSPDYHADGSVTFRCQAPNAKVVELDCQMFPQALPMTKDDKGVWSITVTPGKPDIYPYAFVVDGTKIADPNNMFIFPNEGFKYSLADVRGPEPSIQDIQDVPHGKVTYRFYHSNTCGIDRPLTVYTPAGYNPNGNEKLPVLYLIHGMTDTYETWFKVGRVNNIMDNLIAQGLAKRMIIVMPYANPYIEMMRQGLADRYDSMDTDRVAAEIINDVRGQLQGQDLRARPRRGRLLARRTAGACHRPGPPEGVRVGLRHGAGHLRQRVRDQLHQRHLRPGEHPQQELQAHLARYRHLRFPDRTVPRTGCLPDEERCQAHLLHSRRRPHLDELPRLPHAHRPAALQIA